MASDKAAIRHYAIIALLALNLGITSYATFWRSARVPHEKVQSGTPDISESKALELANEVLALYNSRDAAGLYAKFDGVAKAQLSQEQLTAQLENLYKVLGTPSAPAYVGSVLAGSDGGRDYFNLNYKIKLSQGPFSSGDMRLTVTQRGDGLTLVGFFINGTSQTNQI
jgi:hypothetical protein